MTFYWGIRIAAKIAFSVGFLSLSSFAVSADEHPKAVIELFTSQGCSSCPAADEVLGGYAADDNVIALAYHVDYWNYLGWRDTFSQPEFTERQKRYAVSFRRRGIYTPQAVVNGRNHVVGSSKAKISGLINSYARSGKGLTVPISVKHSEGKIRVATDANSGDATLWMIYFDKDRSVEIKRGENRGKTIVYHNVVRQVSMLGMMKNGKLDVTLSLEEMRRSGYEACAIILQETTTAGTPGPILGATVVKEL